MSSNVGEVMSKLDWYQKTFTAIKRDDSLTEGGRERQFANLRQSYELYGATVYQVFEAAWQELRSNLESVSRARRSASQKADDSWSFERMRYYSEQAKADINKSMNLSELEKHIRSIVDSGSREQARAYLESTSAVLSRYHGVVGAGALTSWMDSQAAKLKRPAEFDKLDEREHELILSAVHLRDKTTAAANMAPQSNVYSLLQQVHIGAKVEPISGGLKYIVEFL